MSETMTTESAAPASAQADLSDADLDKLAGAAFDRVMGDEPAADDAGAQTQDKSEPTPAPAPKPEGRDDKGRFAPKATDAGKDEKPATDAEKAVTEAKDGDEPKADAIPLAPPTSWRALGDQWGELPRAAQEKILAREREINAGFSQQGRIIKQFEPIGQVLNTHKDFLAQSGMEAPQLINGLIGQYQALNANPRQTLAALAQEYRVDPVSLVGDNPAAAIQRIAQQYRIDLLDLVANGAPEAAPSRAADPAITQLQERIAAQDAELRRLSGTMTARERAERESAERHTQARESQVMDTITPVINATPDWDALAPRVAALLPLVQAENPTAPADAILKAAIDEARYADPRVRSKLTAQTAAQTTQAKLTSMTERAGKAQAATAANVKGASSAATAPLSEDAEIEATWRKLGLAS